MAVNLPCGVLEQSQAELDQAKPGSLFKDEATIEIIIIWSEDQIFVSGSQKTRDFCQIRSFLGEM